MTIAEQLEALILASDDGTEHGHNGHPDAEGEPECPGCWADAIRAILAGYCPSPKG